MSRDKKDVFYKKTTVHPTITELSFDVLRKIVEDRNTSFTKIFEELLEESETFQKYKKEILQNGFFKKY
jgi:hypothetical protein